MARQSAWGVVRGSRITLIAVAGSLSCGAFSEAAVVTTTPMQVGGFFDGGVADNDPGHQNYFVGYGTIGGTRTSERRSFFWYHIPAFPGVLDDVTIPLVNKASTSLVF